MVMIIHPKFVSSAKDIFTGLSNKTSFKSAGGGVGGWGGGQVK